MDKFYEEAARLLHNYSINKKIVDQNFCEKIINLLEITFNLKGYFNKITFKNSKDLVIADYEPISRIITFNLDYFKNNIINDSNKELLGNDIYKYYYFINYNALKTLIHEMTHSYQFKMVYNGGPSSLEKSLYVASFKCYNHETKAIENGDYDLINSGAYDSFYYDIYSKDRLYYYSLPSERIAHITGAKMAKDIISIATKDKELNNIVQNIYIDNSFLGYVDYSPSSYVLGINDIHENPYKYKSSKEVLDIYENQLSKCSKAINMNLSDRLMYGLPLSEEEKVENAINIHKSKEFLARQMEYAKRTI